MNAPTEHRRKAHSVRGYPKAALAKTDLQMHLFWFLFVNKKKKYKMTLESP